VTTTRRSWLSRVRLISPALSMRSSRRVTSGSRAIMRSPISPQVRPVGSAHAECAARVLRHGNIEWPDDLLKALVQHVAGAQQRDQQFFFNTGKGLGLMNVIATALMHFLVMAVTCSDTSARTRCNVFRCNKFSRAPAVEYPARALAAGYAPEDGAPALAFG